MSSSVVIITASNNDAVLKDAKPLLKRTLTSHQTPGPPFTNMDNFNPSMDK